MNALNVMHAKGVVHRNINPNNIIASDKKYNTGGKIIDFKFATFEEIEPLFPKPGLPGFIAPELINDKNPLPNEKEDSFSLGVILYSMLYGKYLFEGKTAEKVLMQNNACIIDFGHLVFSKLSYSCTNSISLR
jgi:serine/threonine protein kinase